MWIERLYFPMTVIASVSATVSVWKVATIDLENSPWLWVVVIMWSIGPALWFGLENVLLAQNLGTLLTTRPLWLQQHALYQETAKLLWAGIAALIFGIVQCRS